MLLLAKKYDNFIAMTNSADAIGQLEELQRTNLKETAYDLIYQRLKSLVDVVGKFPAMPYTIAAGRSIYRSRFHDKHTEVFYFERDISYRTDWQNIQSLGRANPTESTVFYGAISHKSGDEGYLVSSVETSRNFRNNKLGIETATIGKWIVKRDMEFVAIVSADAYKNKIPGLDSANNFYQTMLSQHPMGEFVRKLVDYVSDQYAKPVANGDNHEYKISAAFSQILMERGVHGIVYPSVQSEYEGLNVVMMPYVIDENLILDKVLVAQLHRQDYSGKVLFPQFHIADLRYGIHSHPFPYTPLTSEHYLGFNGLQPHVSK